MLPKLWAVVYIMLHQWKGIWYIFGSTSLNEFIIISLYTQATKNSHEIVKCSSINHEQDVIFAENSFLATYSTSLSINIVSKKKLKRQQWLAWELDVPFNIKIQNPKLRFLNIIQFYQLYQNICFQNPEAMDQIWLI